MYEDRPIRASLFQCFKCIPTLKEKYIPATFLSAHSLLISSRVSQGLSQKLPCQPLLISILSFEQQSDKQNLVGGRHLYVLHLVYCIYPCSRVESIQIFVSKKKNNKKKRVKFNVQLDL